MNDRQSLLLASALRPRSTTVNVTEKRAPTDESVRLLKEFEEKAEAKVIQSVAVESNAFNCVVHGMVDGMSNRRIMRAVFDLNGKKMTAEASASWVSSGDTPALARALRDAIAKEIANSAIDAMIPALREIGL
jgi:ABC-type methionine transport system ATPase subunit